MSSIYVTIRNTEVLRTAIDDAGTQRSVAQRIGISAARLNLLATGRRPRVELALAGRIEECLGYKAGALFQLVDAEGLAPYLSNAEVRCAS
ncbi:hypothetical protein [Crossiella sp. CA198]|uniref:hypothetical protein n=1 Tax=Crossiella sp. CA198 TaxID=3455607 RepID=UPI003F8D3115